MDTTVDLTTFLPDFLAEIHEHLEALTQGLLELERRWDDAQLIRELFRSAHTIKGTARMIGYTAVAQVAHAAENVLDDLRERRIPVSAMVVDTLLEAVDTIKDLLASEGPQPESAPIEILSRLESLKGRQQREAGEPGETHPPSPNTGRGTGSDGQLPSPNVGRGAGGESPSPSHEADDTIRVSVARLDVLLKQIGDLAALRTEWEASLLELRTLMRMAGEQRRVTEGALSIVESLPPSAAGARLRSQLLRLRDREDKLVSGLKAAASRAADHLEGLSEIADRMHDDVIGLRLLPLATIFAPLSRTIRDLAREEGKQVEVIVTGGEVELDRHILQEMSEPLLHLVRNAISHGIELPENRVAQGKNAAGRITLCATRQGDRVIIEITDDGRGIDPHLVRQVAVGRGVISADQAAALDDQAALELIYTAGFSTSPFITESSGRGVGMGAVKTAVHALGGTIHVASRPGAGTTFTLSLPLALSLIHVLLVSAGGQTYALPAAGVQALRIEVGVQAAAPLPPLRIDLDGQPVAVAPLAQVLALPSLRSFSPAPPQTQRSSGRPSEFPRAPMSSYEFGRGEGWRNAVLVRSGQSQAALMVDALVDERRVTIRPVGRLLRRSCEFIAGATVLADGAIAFLLDPAGLVSAIKAEDGRRRTEDRGLGLPPSALGQARSARKARILVVDDMATTRELERSILTASGYEVEVAANGAQALERLKEAPFDLVVTDIEMPVMDGLALTSAIRSQRQWARLPVIMVTSLDRGKGEQRGLAAGAQAYIEKSTFTQHILLDTIERLVNGRG